MEPKTKMTQRDIILWHLQNVGTLTRAQAMSEYGIVELPARIVELKRLGHNITSERGIPLIALVKSLLIFINWRHNKGIIQ